MAAGKGTRMMSSLPKVLHRLAGLPLIGHVLQTAHSLQARNTVVITGHGADAVEAALGGPGAHPGLQFARQMPQLGTGHAVQQAAPLLADDGVVLVLSGDVPLIQADTLRALVATCAGQRLALLTIHFADPTGYGRVLRTGDAVQAIVEHKDIVVCPNGNGHDLHGHRARMAIHLFCRQFPLALPQQAPPSPGLPGL